VTAGIPVKWSAYQGHKAPIERACYEIYLNGPGEWFLARLFPFAVSATYATHAEVQQLAVWLDKRERGLS
jgi:hypothetical protein